MGAMTRRALAFALTLVVPIIAGGTLPMTSATPAPAFDTWPEAAPEAAGFASDLAAHLDASFAAGKLKGLHGVVVARDGKLVVERYYAGVDERWGEPLGEVSFGPQVMHDLRSVSKSIVASRSARASCRGSRHRWSTSSPGSRIWRGSRHGAG
jgi:CubicO group peptidase (beta-lactamase class C family)